MKLSVYKITYVQLKLISKYVNLFTYLIYVLNLILIYVSDVTLNKIKNRKFFNCDRFPAEIISDTISGVP